MHKRVLITAGGTGGHIYPAVTLAKQLKERGIEVLIAGGGLHHNRFFERAQLPYHDIACGSLSLNKPFSSAFNMLRIVQGFGASYQLLKKFSPHLTVGFGSYHTLPTLLAAKWRNIPILLHEANRAPGKVNRLLSKYVELTGVHFPDTASLLNGRAIEIPLPLREGYIKNTISHEQARQFFELDPAKMTFLVFGGSQGAKSLNLLVANAVSLLRENAKSNIQLLHITGDQQMAAQLRNQYEKQGIQACVKEFEGRMDLAWQASNLMISRSGAGTIAEAVEFEVPGILIPYPHAMENHQEYNADFLVDVVKGAVKRSERTLTSEILASDMSEFLADNRQQISKMQLAMRNYKEREKPQDLCTTVIEMLQQFIH